MKTTETCLPLIVRPDGTRLFIICIMFRHIRSKIISFSNKYWFYRLVHVVSFVKILKTKHPYKIFSKKLDTSESVFLVLPNPLVGDNGSRPVFETAACVCHAGSRFMSCPKKIISWILISQKNRSIFYYIPKNKLFFLLYTKKSIGFLLYTKNQLIFYYIPKNQSIFYYISKNQLCFYYIPKYINTALLERTSTAFVNEYSMA